MRGALSEMAFSVRYGNVVNVSDDFIYLTFYGYQDASKTNQCIGIAKGVIH